MEIALSFIALAGVLLAVIFGVGVLILLKDNKSLRQDLECLSDAIKATKAWKK